MTLRRPVRHEFRDTFRFPGFTPRRTIGDVDGDPRARIVVLSRRPKMLTPRYICAPVAASHGAILLASNQGLGAWGEVFGDAVIASAILDRLLNHATTINIKGDSYRLCEKRRAGVMHSTLTPHSEP